MNRVSRFGTLLTLLAPLLLSAACAAPSTDDEVAAAESAESAASARPTTAAALVSRGFVLVRTTPIVFTVREPGGASGLTCVGGPDGQTCYAVYRDGNDHFVVNGSADRYEHPDGRVAYVNSQDGAVVGPVGLGAFVSDGATVNVVSFELVAEGKFALSIESASMRDVETSDGTFRDLDGGKSTLTWAGAGTFGDALHTVQFDADGKQVAAYKEIVAFDHYDLKPSRSVSAYHLTRSTCATANYSCVGYYVNSNWTYSWHREKNRYASNDICTARCRRDWSNYGEHGAACLPSLGRACK